ncbi:TMEM43 family protein [Luteimonas suaedae]|uniref:TMEM43 family protein n=1 Tax=Luteimonas suaedae TaxID=2605430 RepID=UPI0011F09A06|nr:TMEM43 family protein [Luteimonas suaedae]
MKYVWLLVLLLCPPAFAQESAEPGTPRAELALVDDEFGVASRQFGLRRHVEMAQWQRVDGEYAVIWSAQPIDSAGFPPQYRNPDEFRLPSREWTTAVTMPDGYPLAEEAVETLGIWRPLTPVAEALPPNMAATFQFDSRTLTTAEDPAAPRAGDLRIRWLERVLPPLQGQVVLRDGAWVVADAPAVPAEAPSADSAEVPPADGEGEVRNYTPWVGGLLLLIVAILVAIRHRHRRRAPPP